MKCSPIIITLLSLSTYSSAQELPNIQTDRPDQTECPFIVPIRYIQLENGFFYEKIKNNGKQIAAPTTLTRYGINDHFELRLTTEYNINSENSKNLSGIVPLKFGFKTQLLQENGIIPTTSFIGQIGLPKLASKSFQETNYMPEFRFAMQHTLSNKQSLSYNLGAEWDGKTPTTTFIYTLTTGYCLTQKLGCYIELYGFIPQNEHPDNRLNGGFTYLFNPNHQLDTSAGIGLSTNSPEYYIAVGYSFRFKI